MWTKNDIMIKRKRIIMTDDLCLQTRCIIGDV